MKLETRRATGIGGAAKRRRRETHSEGREARGGCQQMQKHRMLIGGKWLEPASGEWFESMNPYTAKPWALVPRGNKDDVDRAVAAAKAAFYDGDFRKLTASARGDLLRKLADLIAAEADKLAEIESTDNGNPP